jgi:hypothetical protein
MGWDIEEDEETVLPELCVFLPNAALMLDSSPNIFGSLNGVNTLKLDR